MPKLISTIVGMFLLCAPAIAVAKDRVEPRVQAVLACESVSSSEARLQCYDGAVRTLKQALAGGSVVLKEKKAPAALEGIVRASGQSGENRYWVVLENGDRWTLSTAKPRREAPRPGTALKLKRTPLGNYWISGPGWPESEATFQGRGS